MDQEGGQLRGPEGKGDVGQLLTDRGRTEGRHSVTHEPYTCCNLGEEREGEKI